MDTKPRTLRDTAKRYSIRVVAEATPEINESNVNTLRYTRFALVEIVLYAYSQTHAEQLALGQIEHDYPGYDCKVISSSPILGAQT